MGKRYAPAHDIFITAGGLLQRLAGRRDTRVNSLHGQRIDRVGDDLVVEATSGDGTIEAARVGSARGFTLGVQWHPVWQTTLNRTGSRPRHSARPRAPGDSANTKARERSTSPGATRRARARGPELAQARCEVDRAKCERDRL